MSPGATRLECSAAPDIGVIFTSHNAPRNPLISHVEPTCDCSQLIYDHSSGCGGRNAIEEPVIAITVKARISRKKDYRSAHEGGAFMKKISIRIFCMGGFLAPAVIDGWSARLHAQTTLP